MLNDIKFKMNKFLFLCHIPAFGSGGLSALLERDLKMAFVVRGCLRSSRRSALGGGSNGRISETYSLPPI